MLDKDETLPRVKIYTGTCWEGWLQALTFRGSFQCTWMQQKHPKIANLHTSFCRCRHCFLSTAETACFPDVMPCLFREKLASNKSGERCDSAKSDATKSQFQRMFKWCTKNEKHIMYPDNRGKCSCQDVAHNRDVRHCMPEVEQRIWERMIVKSDETENDSANAHSFVRRSWVGVSRAAFRHLALQYVSS